MIDPDIARAFRDRLRAAPAAATVPGSLPVLFFGDLLSAQVVTVGLNPSDQEYLDRQGRPLAGAAQRFSTLDSLGARSRDELSDDQCDEAVRWMRGYFAPNRPVYGAWFNALSRVVSGFGRSLTNREAAHLDLIQESTTPTWSQLPPLERDGLLRRDLPFLAWQLRTFPIRTVICTSATAGTQVQALLDVTVTAKDQLERVTWWVGQARLDDRRIDVAGWNIPLARATGLGAAGEKELGRRLAAALDRTAATGRPFDATAVPSGAPPTIRPMIQFVLNGVSMELTIDQVRRRLRDVPPEPVRRHGVRINGRVYPVMQAFEAATGIPRREFISHTARRHLASLGFETFGEIEHRTDRAPVDDPPRHKVLATQRPSDRARAPAATDWHTEDKVQAAVVRHLVHQGWNIQSVADTASRERGIDVLAERGGETLAIEVKGYPGRAYADPARAGETKPTHPATQARHWYAQAILAAMLTMSRRPDAAAIIALPDFPTYRTLHRDTSGSLSAARITAWWIAEDGTVRV